jgi:hypothetical protein
LAGVVCVEQDQLRLMDDKYADLRHKLNDMRNKFKREVKNYEEKCRKLRLRWEKETQGAIPLEYVPLPADTRKGGASSAPVRGAAKWSDGPGPGRRSMSEGGSRSDPGQGQLYFDSSRGLISPPPPELGRELLEELAAAGGLHVTPADPWSDQKISGLHQSLEKRKIATASNTPLTTPTSANTGGLLPPVVSSPGLASPAGR